MNTSTDYYYHKISEAILYLQDNFPRQPTLAEVAQHVCISPYHFQRLFSEWVGVSPKNYVQSLSIDHAKMLLKVKGATTLETSMEIGLSGTGRLHDLFIKLEAMTPGEYKKGARQLHIFHEIIQTPFGPGLIASTHKGICHFSFLKDERCALHHLKSDYPYAIFEQRSVNEHHEVMRWFDNADDDLSLLKGHLRGTPFQLKVWRALLTIPSGRVETYGDIAKRIGSPLASRAVGNAIGSNPLAYLIPCHRVIRASGQLGGYRWDPKRKSVMLAWEAVRQEANVDTRDE